VTGATSPEPHKKRGKWTSGLPSVGLRHLEEHRGLVRRNPVDLALFLPLGQVFLLVPLVRLVGDDVDDPGVERQRNGGWR
jgi:hypothetical protein